MLLYLKVNRLEVLLVQNLNTCFNFLRLMSENWTRKSFDVHVVVQAKKKNKKITKEVEIK